MTPAPGPAVVAGRYALADRIAVGGMGEVWRATDTVLERPVAVKLLRADRMSGPDRDRFRAEARHAAALSHSGIASVFDYGEDEDGSRAWLVMELVDGEPLSTRLDREGALPVERVLSLLGQAADALDVAHTAGVVHRDVKPGNLLVRPDGVVKVTDFGIARALDGTSSTTGLMVGTAFYMSPEQAVGQPVTPASDVYALGVVAFECLTGVRPFDGANVADVARAHVHDPPPPLPSVLPAALRSLVLRALSKDPADRPTSAGEFAAALAAVRPSRRRTARPEGTGSRAHLHRRALRLALPLVLLVLLLLAAKALLVDGGAPPTSLGAPPAAGSVVARDGGRTTVAQEARGGR
ncbi:MAG: pknA [Frankiales bacterium]|nr:pknA [Frankiales bacterium]